MFAERRRPTYFVKTYSIKTKELIFSSISYFKSNIDRTSLRLSISQQNDSLMGLKNNDRLSCNNENLVNVSRTSRILEDSTQLFWYFDFDLLTKFTYKKVAVFILTFEIRWLNHEKSFDVKTTLGNNNSKKRFNWIRFTISSNFSNV